MARRPHRRDRRRPAPNTPGGTTTAISAIRLVEAPDPDQTTLQVVRTDANGAAPSYNSVTLTSSANQAIPGIAIYEAGVKLEISQVFVEADGEFSIETTNPRTTVGILIIDPFLPFLNGKNGSVNGGCVIDLPDST